ncbi:MAG TPA: roadblock/LC7 domain-containing protein [Deinococcales bacterium]|nr:roadblock/LC7 domain-containing protein [Deinococcales bacterium]
MNLQGTLRRLLESVEGAVGAAVGGLDGLLVEQAGSQEDLDLATVAAEHASILRNARAAYSRSLGAGPIIEVIVSAERLTGFTRLVNDDYFITVALVPGGNLGRARILAERAGRELAALLP